MNRLSKLSRLVASAKKYRVRLTFGVVCVTLSNLAATVSPMVLKHAIDSLSTFISEERLLYFGGLIVLFAVLEAVFLFLMRRIMIGVSRRIEVDMRADFLRHLQSLSPSFYHRHRTGVLMALATNDLNAVRTLVGPAVMYSMNTVVIGTITPAGRLELWPGHGHFGPMEDPDRAVASILDFAG